MSHSKFFLRNFLGIQIMHSNQRSHNGSKFRLQQKTLGIHLNKVQSLLFVVSSAVLSLGVVFLTSKTFI